ncbi:MAG: hypothetical protein WDZ65_14075, partial [Aquisalimonadaceae bacterium]
MTRTISSVLCATLTLVAIAWTLNVPRWLGLSLYTEQFLAVALALALPIALLEISARGTPRDGAAPLYDWIASVAVFG